MDGADHEHPPLRVRAPAPLDRDRPVQDRGPGGGRSAAITSGGSPPNSAFCPLGAAHGYRLQQPAADALAVHGLETAVVDLLKNATMIVVLDPDGRVRAANEHVCEVLGRAEADVVGADWFALTSPAGERGEARHTFARLIARADEPERRPVRVATRHRLG